MSAATQALRLAPIRSGIEKRQGVAGPSLQMAGIMPSLDVEKEPDNACEGCQDRFRRLHR
jgi:hypothetical protein